jgi:SHS2 domain-containing protein
VAHTADVILEAWGPDLAACCEEAVAALASLYVDGAGSQEVARRSLHLAPGPDDEMLLDLIDEVIFTLDTADGVPVRAEISAAGDGGLDVEVVLADPATVEATGAVPKAVSRSELAVSARPGEVACRFLVDV